MLIAGNKLNDSQRKQVLAAFVHRWTNENEQMTKQYRGAMLYPSLEPIPDSQWIAEHAFHFVQDGSRLMFNRKYAEPVYMVTQ